MRVQEYEGVLDERWYEGTSVLDERGYEGTRVC